MKQVVDSSNYLELASRTCADPIDAIKRIDRDVANLIHAGIGLSTETGEFLDSIKKQVFYGKAADGVNLIEELGDIMWYVALAANTLGADLNQIMKINIKKLAKRYPEKFTRHNALNRDLDAERAVLEQDQEAL